MHQIFHTFIWYIIFKSNVSSVKDSLYNALPRRVAVSNILPRSAACNRFPPFSSTPCRNTSLGWARTWEPLFSHYIIPICYHVFVCGQQRDVDPRTFWTRSLWPSWREWVVETLEKVLLFVCTSLVTCICKLIAHCCSRCNNNCFLST